METKTVFTAITGRANAGKSSLLNKIIGEKIAIISDKPQTTRTKINGILTKNNTQYVFIDTPGMHKPKNKLSEHMVKSIHEGISDVDAVLLITDATRKISEIERHLIEDFKLKNQNVILILNKIDLIKNKLKLLEVIKTYSELYDFEAIIPISALSGEGVEQILSQLDKFAVESPFYYPEDESTDQTERSWVAEIVREKLLNNMYEEIPHGIAVEVETFSRRNNKDKYILDIGVVIYCEKDTHKGMVIGKNGELLKKVGTLARVELEEFYGITVNLKCFVKVKDDWRNNERFISDIGLSIK